MKYVFALSIILTNLEQLIAQKQLIDSSVYSKWPSVEGAAISNDGNYVTYYIKNQPIGKSTFIMQGTKSSWKLEVPCSIDIPKNNITGDSRFAIFTISNDSLMIVQLGASSIEYISNLQSFKIPDKDSSGWLMYQLNNFSKELVVRNLSTRKIFHFTSVNYYQFSNTAEMILIQKNIQIANKMTQTLQLVRLDNGKLNTIWQGTKCRNFVFDESDTQLAFLVEEMSNYQTEIWYYKTGMDSSFNIANHHSAGVDSSLQIENIEHFNKDGNWILFRFKEKERSKPVNGAQLDVWNYKDSKLQSQQLMELLPNRYHAILHIRDHRIIRLEQEDEACEPFTFKGKTEKLAMIFHGIRNVNETECHWNPACNRSVYIIYTKDGNRKLIKKLKSHWGNMSPEGKYIIYYDQEQKNYFSYEIESDILLNITKMISTSWLKNKQQDERVLFNFNRGIAGWVKNDDFVLIYDENDIWKVDPRGKEKSVNVTNWYGRKNNIVFYLTKNNLPKSFDIKERFILTAFNRSTKENGFFSKYLNQIGDPARLTMGPYIYHIPEPPLDVNGGFAPIKAVAESYIVSRMSATDSPNYFYTSDFISFIQLSYVYPEKNYNWLATELHKWKLPNGRICRGVLYKPQNFDSRKKYPIILYYYRTLSDGLNEYIEPKACDGRLKINIPYFVSNGYLVFTPDIQYKIGKTGKSALNSIVSAAKYLSKLHFIDAKKIGIQGHSFGGFETNYIITHTNIFAAACSSSGLYDLISGYGSLSNYESKQGQFEVGPYQIGATLWKKPNLYIENSAIFKADKVTTPFLMMHTTNDGSISISQAIEFYSALRRLHKKSWMLQYNDGFHVIWGNSAYDFSIRIAQFFDHFLKGKAAPKWMTKGIGARMKGIDVGFELDPEGKCSDDCSICNPQIDHKHQH